MRATTPYLPHDDSFIICVIVCLKKIGGRFWCAKTFIVSVKVATFNGTGV